MPEDSNNQDDQWDDPDDSDNSVSPQSVGRAVVTDTDWTTETILSQLRRGNIQLNPRFQRRDAWDRERKSRFIESLILGFPIPQLVLAESRERRGAFIVLDGKQRLLALRQFAEGSSIEGSSADEEFQSLHLRGLDIREDLVGLNLADLERDGDYIDDLNSFLNQSIRTVVVRNWPSEDFLNIVFLRLNTGSVQLSPQELRQALHPGKFTDFLDDYSATSQPIQNALRIKAPDFRMRDVEITLRFFAFHLFLDKYRGELKGFLDETTNELNNLWADEEEYIKDVARQLDDAIETTFNIFEEDAFFRWNGNRYEHRFNRAIFDAIVFYFADPRVRHAAMEAKDQVVAALKNLCVEDTDFTRSIQLSTKTIWATTYRISAWGVTLQEVIGLPLNIPPVAGTRSKTSS